MPRRLANGLTLLSAVVCVGSAMLVGRSFWRVDTVTVPVGRTTQGAIAAAEGQLWLIGVRARTSFSYEELEYTPSLRSEIGSIWGELHGIRWLGSGYGRYGGTTYLILPLWLLPLLTAIPPVWWWRKRRRDGGRGFAVQAVLAESAGRD
ncbi:MAG TPA: hypothetical protein VGR35_05065 [Tepidisphaeraceae bacterium]|nr:hypothetical protein [Tepidisphaeraceae bacterium]